MRRYSRTGSHGATINNVVATKSFGFFGASPIEIPKTKSGVSQPKTSNELFVEEYLCEAIAKQDVKKLRQIVVSDSIFQYMGGSNGLTMDFLDRKSVV